jgi:hypothetical protein
LKFLSVNGTVAILRCPVPTQKAGARPA